MSLTNAYLNMIFYSFFKNNRIFAGRDYNEKTSSLEAHVKITQGEALNKLVTTGKPIY